MEKQTQLRSASNREELVGRIADAVREDGVVEPLPGVHLARASRQVHGIHSVYRPALCIIAQGAKEIYIGDSRHRYDANHYLLATIELPAIGSIVQASEENPYLSLRLNLDTALVGSIMVETGLQVPRSQADAKAIVVSTLDADLLDATVRLVRLIDSPADARVLGPLVKREIVYRLLTGQQGNRLRHFAIVGSHSHSIAKAVDILRKEYDRPVKIEELARELGMSASGFHHHFRNIIDMSPLQFQKQLRLQEARRLMLGESLDAASAGFKVGYGDPSHFSRDYKKQFGVPPARDVGDLRVNMSAVSAASNV